jgi:hypothetical protein
MLGARSIRKHGIAADGFDDNYCNQALSLVTPERPKENEHEAAQQNNANCIGLRAFSRCLVVHPQPSNRCGRLRTCDCDGSTPTAGFGIRYGKLTANVSGNVGINNFPSTLTGTTVPVSGTLSPNRTPVHAGQFFNFPNGGVVNLTVPSGTVLTDAHATLDTPEGMPNGAILVIHGIPIYNSSSIRPHPTRDSISKAEL